MVCSGKLTIKPSELSEVYLLAPHLRQADLEEVNAQGQTAEQALEMGCKYSDECYSVLAEGKVIGMFGASSFMLPKGYKAVWFLGSDESEKYPLSFVKEGRNFIKKVLKTHNIYNMVYAGNVGHIQYIERIGLTVDKEHIFWTKQGFAFYQFYKLREE